jgi:hypothetical protein
VVGDSKETISAGDNIMLSSKTLNLGRSTFRGQREAKAEGTFYNGLDGRMVKPVAVALLFGSATAQLLFSFEYQPAIYSRYYNV